jgi:hypothetical protein
MSLLRAAMIAPGLLAFAGSFAPVAHAQSGMCADALVAESVEASTSEELASPEEPAPSEGLEVVELDELTALAPRAPIQDERDLPWCTSPSDARCSKLPAGSTPGGMSAFDIPSLAVQRQLPLPTASSAEHSFAPRAADGPRDAKQHALERPPR